MTAAAPPPWRTRPVVVLDDDPTGAQAVAQTPIALRWDATALAAATASRPPALHILTNTRAVDGDEARRITAEAAGAARAALPDARLVLRGDSTLRGHVLEEYRGLVDALGGSPPVLLLALALPAAGRVTLDGVHRIHRDGAIVPLHDTEYARDGVFRYPDAHLLAWADHRSGGYFARERGEVVGLAELRTGGPQALADALRRAAERGSPAVCAVDAEDVADLELTAAGLAAAEADGVPVAVRCAPTFAAVLGGNLASGPVAPPPAGRGVLVLCGSYVPTTTLQLAALRDRRRAAFAQADVRALADDGAPADAEVERLARFAGEALDRDGLAVVATERDRVPGSEDLRFGERVARRLASLLGRLDPLPGVIVLKGGITSAVGVRDGLGVDAAWVVGPLAPGISLWRTGGDGEGQHVAIHPGNVGNAAALADLVDLLEAGAHARPVP